MSRAENEGEQEREFCRVEKKTLLPLFVFSSLLFPCSSSSPPLSQEKSLTLRSGAGDHQGDRDRGEEEAGRGHCCWLEAVERRKKRERVLKGFLSVEFFFLFFERASLAPRSSKTQLVVTIALGPIDCEASFDSILQRGLLNQCHKRIG